MKSKIALKLTVAFALILMTAFFLLYRSLVPHLRTFFIHYIETTLIEKTDLLHTQFSQLSRPEWKQSTLQPLAVTLGDKMNARITVIHSTGKVLADSFLPKDQLEHVENHLGRPEVIAAQSGNHGVNFRYSTTLDVEMMYVATKVPYGFVRAALPLTEINALIRDIKHIVLTALSLSLGCALLLSFLLSRSASKRLNIYVEAAKKMANGNFPETLIPRSQDELATLGNALNEMAKSLRNQRKALVNEKNLLQTILDSMNEGVIVTNAQHSVILANPAAAKIFSIPPDYSGKSLLECVRHPEISTIIQHSLETQNSTTREITLHAGESERYFMLSTTALHIPNSAHGAISLFYDMTKIRQLENLRRDFVANVSHELKTPLTAIRGYAETLQSLSPNERETTERFIEKIEANALHLQNLVEELLQLSKIESGKMGFHLQPVALSQYRDHIDKGFAFQLTEKNLNLIIDLPESIPFVYADPQALHQILSNLVDNAIKYNRPKGSVTLTASQHSEKDVIISVSDNGLGIPEKDIPRIFERFYRIDKARSRSIGGTGLGLAIVKHLVQSMGGVVSVSSEVDKGSTFSFTLPIYSE